MAIVNSSFHRTKSGTLRGASSLLMIQRGTVLRQDFGATKGNGVEGRDERVWTRIVSLVAAVRLALNSFFFFIKVIYASHRKNWQYGSELKDSLFIILASWFSISRVPSIFSYFSSCTKKKNEEKEKEGRKKKKKRKKKRKIFAKSLFLSSPFFFFSSFLLFPTKDLTGISSNSFNESKECQRVSPRCTHTHTHTHTRTHARTHKYTHTRIPISRVAGLIFLLYSSRIFFAISSLENRSINSGESFSAPTRFPVQRGRKPTRRENEDEPTTPDDDP